MHSTTETRTQDGAEGATKLARWGEAVALLLILALAGGLRLWGLDQNGFGNPYYAAAVRSMLVSESNFFFGAFDPIGFITVDKPPVALWIQATSAKIFGFRGVALLIPQAVMGVASVLVTYWLVRRTFGRGAGLIAGLALAVTPISVAVDRDNLPDTALVLVLLLAAWALSRAAETGRWTLLLLATAFVGIGFNVKMLAAFVVLPTFYLVYLLAAPVRWWKRVIHLAAATLVLAAVSLSWSVAVELTPADQRPYIGGSRSNSALELALGYNGLGRVFGGSGNFSPGNRPPGPNPGGPAAPDGQPPTPVPTVDVIPKAKLPKGGFPLPPGLPGKNFPPFPPGEPDEGFPPFPPGDGFVPGGMDAGFPPFPPKGAKTDRPPFPPGGRPQRGKRDPGRNGPDGSGGNGGGTAMDGPPRFAGRGPGFGGMPPPFGGTPGVLRFAGMSIAGQITWLFPLAIVGGGVAAVRAGRRWPLGPQHLALLLWVGWLGTHLVVFSFARGIFHEYYTTVMGPAVAALAGVGTVALWREWFGNRGRRGFLPMALFLTAVWEAFVINREPDVRRGLLPVIAAGIGLGLLGSLAARWLAGREWAGRGAQVATALGLLALLVGPVCWSVAVVVEPGNPVIPGANPAALVGGESRGPGGMGPPPFRSRPGENDRLIEFLRANRRGERFFVVAEGCMPVAGIIIDTGESAIALGGFLGADPTVSEEQFAQMVQDGQVRFVLIGGPGPPTMGGGGPGGFPPPMAGGGGPPGGPGNSAIRNWVKAHGKEVDPHLWRSDESEGEQPGPAGPVGPPGRMNQLYDCKPELGLVAPPSRARGEPVGGSTLGNGVGTRVAPNGGRE